MNPDQLRLASEAFQRGEISHARTLVAQVLLADSKNEQAWILMARLVNTREQVIDCLEHASKINPANLATISALKTIRRGKSTQVEAVPSPTPLAPTHPGGLMLEKPAEAVKPVGPSPKSWTFSPTTLDAIQPPRQKLNRSLIIGSLVVLSIILFAFIGPKVAPHDPMEEHAVLQVGDKFVIPPFNPFEIPGYLLGSDQFGRDMLSRILYAVRPTLIMVSIVAMVRLFLGTLIGLAAGWSGGRLGRFLDGLISIALAVPILLVALGAITIVGADTGLAAFIVGLSINGWGETARFVHEQTQLIKGQLFVESARALGASAPQILTQHILRQIMPMIWMLLAFEISGTLMVTAGLGFLGYYIGGDIWIDVADFISQRTSGAPELGQMLATSWGNLLRAWPLVITGLIIFIMVLGFNLLGEGLRWRLNPEFISHTNPLNVWRHRFSLWFEESISYPTSKWLKANRLRPALIIFTILALPAGLYLYKTEYANRFNPSQAALTVPGGQIWAAQKVDPYGTYFLNSIGPTSPTKLWMVNHPAGFSGSPVISADGTIYAAGLDGTLLALSPDGATLWQVDLPETPLGPLAMGPQGTIYITDSKGGLSAYNPDGSFLWTFTVQVNGMPNHGAIVDPAGSIYYLIENSLGDILIAVQSDGRLLWSIKPGTRAAATGLRLSPDGKQIFVKNVVVNALDGSLVELTLPTQDNTVVANQAHLLVGADGKTYLLAGHVVMQWKPSSQGINIVRKLIWNYRQEGLDQVSDLPMDAGVTPTGEVWLFYSRRFAGTSVYWLDPAGKILGRYSSQFSRSTSLVAIDGDGIVFTCGMGFSIVKGAAIMCEAYRQNATSPTWSYAFDEGADGIAGAAMAPGRLYVVTSNGNLTAIGDTVTSSTMPISTP